MRTLHIPPGKFFRKPIKGHKCDCANAGDTDVHVVFSEHGEFVYDSADRDAFMTTKGERYLNPTLFRLCGRILKGLKMHGVAYVPLVRQPLV